MGDESRRGESDTRRLGVRPYSPHPPLLRRQKKRGERDRRRHQETVGTVQPPRSPEIMLHTRGKEIGREGENTLCLPGSLPSTLKLIRYNKSNTRRTFLILERKVKEGKKS